MRYSGFGSSKGAGVYLSDICEEFKVSRRKMGWLFYVISIKLGSGI